MTSPDIEMNREEFNETTKFARYSYQRSPVNERAFMILLREDGAQTPEPVGDYTVLDQDEDLSLSEKKIINIITMLNEKPGKMISLSGEADGRVQYQVLSEPNAENDLKVLFYSQKGEGVSAESALFRVRNDDTIWN